MKKDILSYDFEELKQEIEALGEKRFRAEQIYSWLHIRLACEFDEMTNLSRELRKKLSDAYEICPVRILSHRRSSVDATEKYLFEFGDGNCVESVLMPTNYGNSVCISSQAGCRMGCVFCASTIGGLQRNLKVSEMLTQVYHIQRKLGERISNVVIMGTGEPMDNYEVFVKAVRMLSDEKGLNISQRSITASTCGIVPGIRKLAGENLQITLALSLHGATQEKRKQLMPVANKYKLDEVMEACRYYFEKTGRRVTFEYSLVTGVNDTEEDVKELASLLRGNNCHLNLIPVNPIREKTYTRPEPKKIVDFQNKLEKNGINVTIRKERGTDIDGACGQLRQRYAGKERENHEALRQNGCGQEKKN